MAECLKKNQRKNKTPKYLVVQKMCQVQHTDKKITRFTNRQTGHGENSVNYFLNCIFLQTGDR